MRGRGTAAIGEPPSSWRGPLQRALIALALAAWIGLARRANIALTPEDRTVPLHVLPAIGLPAGVLVAWPRRWPEVLAALAIAPAFIVLGPGDVEVVPLLFLAGAHAFAARFLLQRFLGNPVELRRATHAMVLLGACLLIAAAGAGLLAAARTLVDPDSVGHPVAGWADWLSGVFVELAITIPAVLALRTRSPRLALAAGRREAGLAVVLLATVLALAATESFAFSYFAAPLSVWLAIRFGPLLAAPSHVVVVGAISAIVVANPALMTEPDADTRLTAFTMAYAAGGLVTIYLAQQATDDRQQLQATLAALPETIVLTGPGGRILDLWETPDRAVAQHELQAFVDEAEQRPAGDEHRVSGDRTLEHLWRTAGNGRRLHIVRDVTLAATLDKERRRRREEVEMATLAEQRRIAVRLNGGPIQQLSAILLRQGSLLDAPDPAGELQVIETQLAKVIAELRAATDELIPPDVGAGSVGEALRGFAPRVLDADVAFEVDDQHWVHVSAAESKALFLAGREAIVNAADHADPSRVHVTLTALPGRAVLSVADDGQGFATNDDGRGRLGLRLATERLAELGGELQVTTSRWGGVLVVASVPRPDVAPTPGCPDGAQGRGAPSTFAS